ncbi:MAG: hypothetical protein ACREAY_03665 [Nitrososphaera sp.]|uniref:hypothetical protein n=1 Tax=Nitrososphaera sp. TaxID=1971748 RepID=UPI003D6EBA37
MSKLQSRARENGSWKLFHPKARAFVKNTDRYVRGGVNPGDYYKAIWCRDAAYILKDLYLTGDVGEVMQAIHFIWSHQMTPGKGKIVYGRGSPDMKFLSQVANPREEKKFEGALPSTIYDDSLEVYAKNPDIDSTALMISTTSWIFDTYLRAGLLYEKPGGSLASKAGQRKSLAPEKAIDFAVPRMLKAVDYLAARDIDGDGLLEQDHNEDWMDTVLRAGKIVYSQACWILALTHLSSLLSRLCKEGKAKQMVKLANNGILAVEKHLWSDEEGCYIDKQASHHMGREYKTLTQDVSLYLVAVTENTVHDMLSSTTRRDTKRQNKHPLRGKVSSVSDKTIRDRANMTLDAIENRIWKDRWPLVTEAELKTTGPWVLQPNQYHNHTFWPWTTGIEMLARSRFKRFDECSTLLSSLIRGRYPHDLAFYEWVDPVTGKGRGAFPFRTGISAVRIAITDILTSMHQLPAYKEESFARHARKGKHAA